MFVDSHCHLDYIENNEELVLTIERAVAAGVLAMQTISTKLEHIGSIKKIIEQHANVFGSVGIHPNEVRHEDLFRLVERLTDEAAHPKIIGIGETGLDYYHQPIDKITQQKSFVSHFEAATDLDLPVIIHSRHAEDDTIAIIRQFHQKQGFRAVLHCFSSSKDLALAALDMGCYISLAGIITFKNADDLREIVKSIPLDRILLETDSPYLAPQPCRGRENEPALMIHTAAKLAEIKNISLDKLGATTTSNFYNLFKKAL